MDAVDTNGMTKNTERTVAFASMEENVENKYVEKHVLFCTQERKPKFPFPQDAASTM